MTELNMTELCKVILAGSLNKKLLLVGIDGCGGAGKSTFAMKLKNQLGLDKPITIVHMDDFYFPSEQRKGMRGPDLIGIDFDWRRLFDQVIKPLSSGEEGYYQRYDWNEDKLLVWHRVPLGVVIIEGVYTLRNELYDYYDYTIWIETDHGIRLTRGIERDGEKMRDMWENVWMPAEQRYVEIEKPNKKADLIINGTG
ncbi:uridine kinase family protein [Paenibacillus sp. KN14-4R]|uniref:uridine kinase family protein n=1 Tax=Paenibacillus sp. KN14-4R TaxID=3445773 RepID=UPI003FA1400F